MIRVRYNQYIYIKNRRMLPLIKQSQSQTSTNSNDDKSRLKKSTISKISKITEQVLQVEQKLQNQLIQNDKLKQILNNVRENVIDVSITANQQQDQIASLMKQRRKQQTQLQHQAHILNILISDNAKLKDRVNSERNKRAIYFNVYKNLEHEIHEWEVKYKNLLIQSMKSEGAITKLKEKFRKATKKMQRDIQSLNSQLNNLSKLEAIEAQKSKDLANIQTSQNTPINENEEKQKNAKNRKSVDNQLEYELEQKTILASGIINRLKNITGLSDINEIIKFYRSIDQQIQEKFKIFKQEEKNQKDLLDRIHLCEQELERIEGENVERHSSIIFGVDNLTDLAEKNKKILELENNLELKIGIKVSQLSNEMLLHHCLRVRDEKRQGKKNLEKHLEQTKKEKPQHSILLSPRQMHKKIIQGQTSMI